MSRADIPDEEFELWPDAWPALRLFEAMSTQWRVSGMGGAIGLDYAALPAASSLLGMKKREAREAFNDLRVLEAEALRVMSEACKTT